jgi:hypothetical protein
MTKQQDIEAIMRRTVPVTESGCLLWEGACYPYGYGRICRNGKIRGAHRVVYELTHGPIPRGLFVCHRCDVPCCVNINHLLLGTHRENMRDCKQKGRLAYQPGVLHGQAKLTEEQVKWIRAQSGVSNTAMARALGVSRQIVSAIVHRVRWKHVV